MRRVVSTGFGITSCLGLEPETVKDSLYHGRSGISANAKYAEMGFRSQVSGSIRDLDLDALIDQASLHPQPLDELRLRRLKKRRLALRDQIAQLQAMLDPKEPA